MYPDKTTDKIMIPQWEYRRLRDTATRVNVVLSEMEANRYMTIEEVKRILAPHREKEYTELPPAQDDIADALGYTE